MQEKKPYDNKRIFWDVDAEKLDFEKKASFIIERVFERGDVEDIRMCRRFYGDEKIAIVLINAKWLMPETIYLAAALFNNNPEDYRCYKLQQLNQTPFRY
ncbi:MAG: hypothetical protein RIR31_1731 [Bacteroidota bacterium]|jgi:hypothetical protein